MPRPPRELKAFAKVFLEPGEMKTVSLELSEQSLSIFDPNSSDWIAEPGEYTIFVGPSSQDTRLKESFTWVV